MRLTKTSINGLFEFNKTPFYDQRGMFQRLFDYESFEQYLDGKKILHVNHSKTNDLGVVRGLHLQLPPFQEIKFVQAIRGRILDIAVDMRKNSPTFLQHICLEISAEKNNGLILPYGIAHGFQVLEENTELIYFHTERYVKDSEMGFNVNDPRLKISLPLPIKFISERDSSHPPISDDFKGI